MGPSSGAAKPGPGQEVESRPWFGNADGEVVHPQMIDKTDHPVGQPHIGVSCRGSSRFTPPVLPAWLVHFTGDGLLVGLGLEQADQGGVDTVESLVARLLTLRPIRAAAQSSVSAIPGTFSRSSRRRRGTKPRDLGRPA